MTVTSREMEKLRRSPSFLNITRTACMSVRLAKWDGAPASTIKIEAGASWAGDDTAPTVALQETLGKDYSYSREERSRENEADAEPTPACTYARSAPGDERAGVIRPCPVLFP